MDSPPILFETDSELGQSSIAAMELAGEYAYAGRDVVVAKALERSRDRRGSSARPWASRRSSFAARTRARRVS